MKEAQRVKTVPGFWEFFSVLVTTEIADISRFEDAARLHPMQGSSLPFTALGKGFIMGRSSSKGIAGYAGRPWKL